MDSAFRRSYRENLFAEAVHSACSPTLGSPAARGVMFDDPSELRDDHLTGKGRRLKAKADMVLRMALAGMRAGDSP